MSFLETYDTKNMNWWGKLFLIFSAFQLVSYFLTSSSEFMEATLLDTVLNIIFSGAVMLGFFYQPLEEKLDKIGNDYINYIVIPSYILEVGSYILMTKIHTIEHTYSIYIKFFNLSVDLFKNIEGALFVLNMIFMTTYFVNVFMKTLGVDKFTRMLVFTVVMIVGAFITLSKFNFI